MMLGGSGVGKTAILKRFLYNDFAYKHEPTLEQLTRAEYEIGDDVFTIDLLDTSGTYQFTGMRNLAIDSGDAFVLVYSVDDEDSFKEVERLRDEITDKRVSVPIVVVANKSDKDMTTWQVNSDHIESLVEIEWEHGFIEASAKTDENIIQIFTELMDRSDQHVMLSPAARRRRDSYQPQHKSSLMEGRKRNRRLSLSPSSHGGENSASSTKVACSIM